jgi:hypothetical protein
MQDPIVQRLSKGWLFERTLRLIFPSQMELLSEAGSAAYVPERRAQVLFESPTDLNVKSRSFADFIGFLVNSQLLSVVFPDGLIGYSITARGRQFLEFSRQIRGGVVWPLVPYDDSMPLDTDTAPAPQ